MAAKKKITQSDLYDMIQTKTDQSKSSVHSVMSAFQDAVVESLEAGKEVAITLGSFRIVKRKARKGRNPHTGEALDIPAKKAAKFRIGQRLKTAAENA